MKFGVSSARAQRANADAVGLQFFREPFRKQQVESLRCRVCGNVGNGLERSGGGEDEDITVASRDHPLQEKMRQMNDRGAIHLYHIEQTLFCNRMEFAVFAEACVVDEQINVNSLVAREGENLFRSGGSSQIGRKDLRLYLIGRRQPLRESVEAIFATRREHDVRSAAGELLGESYANPRAGAGYQGPFARPSCTRIVSLRQINLLDLP